MFKCLATDKIKRDLFNRITKFLNKIEEFLKVKYWKFSMCKSIYDPINVLLNRK